MSTMMIGAINANSTGPQIGMLEQAKNHLESCHDWVTSLEGIAGQHVGEAPAQEKQSPTPVPNGSADHLRTEAYRLSQRLASLVERLQRL